MIQLIEHKMSTLQYAEDRLEGFYTLITVLPTSTVDYLNKNFYFLGQSSHPACRCMNGSDSRWFVGLYSEGFSPHKSKLYELCRVKCTGTIKVSLTLKIKG